MVYCIHYILYTIYYILYTIHSTLYTICRIQYTDCCILLYTSYYLAYPLRRDTHMPNLCRNWMPTRLAAVPTAHQPHST